MSDGLQVLGGVGGLDVECADLTAAARILQTTAAEAAEVAWAARGVIGDVGLVASAVLDPGGFARVEAAVLAAVAGPHGLLAAAGRLEGTSVSLRAAVLRYHAADELGAGWREIRQWAEVAALTAALPALPLVAVSPVGVGVSVWARDGRAEAFLSEHPGVVEDLAGGLPEVLQSLALVGTGRPLPAGQSEPPAGHHPLFGGALERAAALLGALYPTGHVDVRGRGVDTSAPPAPTGVGDLIAALDHRDGRAIGDAQGEIDVRRLSRVGPDGREQVSWVVDLPGTKAWQFDPRHRDHLNDLATNLTSLAGAPSLRVDGVTRALELAGVRRGEPVMLVGHSQGGLVALRAAEDYARDGRFTVTHVVTAGSPTARMAVPPSVSVLSLENRYDLVPRLDGAPPSPDANRVTVVFDAQSHDIGRNHAADVTYLPAARRVDDDHSDPSLTAWRAGAAAFLSTDGGPVQVRTTVWDLRVTG